MVLHDPIQRIELDADLVAATWDLTAAEACAAVALARGQTPKALARESGPSLNTIRSQLQATMAKTGTRRQAQLVSLLLSMPVMPGTGLGDGAPQQRGVPPPRAD